MSYTKTNWTDGTTPLDASNMNKIEDALSDQDSRIDANTDLIDSSYNLPIYVFSTSSSVLDQAIEILSNSSGRRVLFGYCGAQADINQPTNGANYFYMFIKMSASGTNVNAFSWRMNSNYMYVRYMAASSWDDSWTLINS